MMTQHDLVLQENRVIPEGYKQTEFGVIPESWEINTLEHFTDEKRPICYGIVQTGPKINSGVPCLRVVDILDKKINTENLIYTTQEISSSYKRTILKKGDLVFPLRGKIGTVGLINEELVGANLTRGVALIALKKSNPIFLKQLFGSHKILTQLHGSMNGSALQEITIDTLKKFKVVMPDIVEQQKIATALSDTDVLISELEKLIEKKQAIKNATMQQLLTGKTRLPEFALREDGTPKSYKYSELGQIPEDWEVTRIGNTLTVKHGKSQKSVESDNGTFPILATGGQIGWAKEYLYNQPTVLIGRKGTINKPKFFDQPFWSVDTLFYSEVNVKYSAKFLFYKFCRIDWNNYNEASGVPSLNAKTIENVLISVCSLEEQKAIVKILNDIENEITGLKDKRKKLLHIKSGIMQELLTGKTRLV